MDRFHILQVTDGEGAFREVEGEEVNICEDATAFVTVEKTDVLEYWNIYDMQTGANILGAGSKAEAVRLATKKMESMGNDKYNDRARRLIELYGRSPSAPDIEVIQEPKEPGEIKTCEADCVGRV